MIGAYIGSALVGAGTYFLMRRKKSRPRILASVGVFLVLGTLFTIWFIQTGGTYGIMGTNGINPDWAN